MNKFNQIFLDTAWTNNRYGNQNKTVGRLRKLSTLGRR